MGLHYEIKEFLVEFEVEDSLSSDEKYLIANEAESKFPISLSLMKYYGGDKHSRLETGEWNAAEAQFENIFSDLLPSQKYYLFISGKPKNFLYYLDKIKIARIIAHPNFSYYFAIFSHDFSSFLISAAPEIVAGAGEFSPIISTIRSGTY